MTPSTPQSSRALKAALVLSSLAFAGTAYATEDFKLRFPLSGALGGEIVAPIDNPGWFGSTFLTSIKVDKVTDNEGNPRTQTKTTVLTNNPLTHALLLTPVQYTARTNLDVKQTQTHVNLLIGYLTEPNYGGGRLSFIFNLPYTIQQERTAKLSGETPTVTAVNPLHPAATATASAIQNNLNINYQAGLANQSAGISGVTEGWGDAEITGAWVYRKDNMKLVTGVTLAIPTGKYNASETTLDTGFGNFYTLRAGAAVSTDVTPLWTVGAKASLGFNTRNKDTDIRSGNFAALDVAAVYRTSLGVVGPHFMHVQQFQNDSMGTSGKAAFGRFSANGVGAVFTTLIKPIDAGLNFSYMTMIDSKNALSGSFLQVRLSKAI
jgi:hypothetical protein